MIYPIRTSYGKGNFQALQICKDLASLAPPTDEDLVFDISSYGEANPFSNLLLVNSLRRFRAEYPNASLRCRPKDRDGYLSHIGFYKSCGISIGKEPGEARPSPNYVPITDIRLYDDGDFYRNIDEKAKVLAATLEFDAALQEMLTYIFIETIRNVYEHTNCQSVWVAAQKWPSQGLVEIAIADTGCGISGSLGKFFAVSNPELLRLACKPGVSARSNYRYLEPDNQWRNSGYGLYIMKELTLAYNGSFILCSGGHALRFARNDANVPFDVLFNTDYKGTALGLRFNTESCNDFEEIRKEIVARGQLLSEQIKGAIRTASRSSGGRYHFD